VSRESVELFTGVVSFCILLKYIVLFTKYLSDRESPCNLVLLIKEKSDDTINNISNKRNFNY